MNFSTSKRVIAVTPSNTDYITGVSWQLIYPSGSGGLTLQTPTSATLASDLFTLASSGLANGDIIVFDSVGTITGISINTQYYIVGVSGNDFQVSLTYGGSAVDLGGATTTMPTFRKEFTFQTIRKTGFLNVTTSGTYRILPVDHFDTNTTTVAPMGAQDVYIAAGVPFPVQVKKVFTTGSATTTGITLLSE
jgi:hypothetical protein